MEDLKTERESSGKGGVVLSGVPSSVSVCGGGRDDNTKLVTIMDSVGSSSGGNDNINNDFSSRLREAMKLYKSVSSSSSPTPIQEQSAARCVPIQSSSNYSSRKESGEEESPEDIATFKINSLKLLEQVAGLFEKEEERVQKCTTEISSLRGSLNAKDREVESLKEQLSAKTAREEVLVQENQRLRRQLEMLLRIGPTRHRDLMAAASSIGPRGSPNKIMLPPPLVETRQGQGHQNLVHNNPNNNQGSIQVRSYSSLALRRFGRVSDSPPKLLPAVTLKRRPASAAGNLLSLEWSGVGGNDDDDDVSSPDENEDEEAIVAESSSSGSDEFEDEEEGTVASTTSGISVDSTRYRISDMRGMERPGGRAPKRGRPRKKQTWPAHYTTHPMLQLSCKNLPKRPRPSPPPEVTSSVDKDSPSRKRKKPLQEIVDSQAKSSNSSHQSHLSPVPRRKSATSAPKSLMFTNELEQCMTTRIPYRISLMEDRMNELLKAQEAEESRSEGNVEVPEWRIKVYEPVFDPSPFPEIEDVSEAVLLKRHQRLEVDEKRRKRWDSQRAREETYLDRLKRRIDEREKQKVQRRKAAAGRKLNSDRQTTSGIGMDSERGGKAKGSGGNGDGGSDDEMTSVHPKPEDIRYIRVGDDIPISMFGVPLPIIPHRKFDIPWRPNRLLVTQKNGLSTITSPTENDTKSSCPIYNCERSPPSPPTSSPIVTLPSPPPNPTDEDNCPDTGEDSSSSSVSSLLSLPSPTIESHLVKHDSFDDQTLSSSTPKSPSKCLPKDPFDFDDDDQDLDEGLSKTLLRKEDNKVTEAEKVTSSVSSPAADKPESEKVFVFHSPSR